MASSAKFIFKVVIIGDSLVGKSSLFVRYIDNEYIDTLQPTIGVDYRPHFLKIEDNWIKLMIWDTAGQERFRSITKSFYHGAHGAIIVYDVTNMLSLYDVRSWLNELRKITGDISIVLVGNKADDTDLHQTNDNATNHFANEHNLAHFLVSAKTGSNVNEAFTALVQQMLEKHKIINIPDGRIKIPQTYKYRSCWC